MLLKVVCKVSAIYPYFFLISRWLVAFSSIALIITWARYFCKTKSVGGVLAALVTADKISLDVSLSENIIGRTPSADIMIPVRGVQKRHAILSLKNNRWFWLP